MLAINRPAGGRVIAPRVRAVLPPRAAYSHSPHWAAGVRPTAHTRSHRDKPPVRRDGPSRSSKPARPGRMDDANTHPVSTATTAASPAGPPVPMSTGTTNAPGTRSAGVRSGIQGRVEVAFGDRDVVVWSTNSAYCALVTGCRSMARKPTPGRYGPAPLPGRARRAHAVRPAGQLDQLSQHGFRYADREVPDQTVEAASNPSVPAGAWTRMASR